MSENVIFEKCTFISEMFYLKNVLKMRVVTLFLVVSFFFSLFANGQSSSSVRLVGRGGVGVTMATDYQAIGVNPANIGIRESFRSPRFCVGIWEGSFGMSSEGMKTTEAINSILNNQDKSKGLTFAEKQALVSNYADKPLSVDIDAMQFGASAVFGKNGIAFSIKDRLQAYIHLNPMAAEIAFLGFNSSYFPRLLLNSGDTIDNPLNTGVGSLTENERNKVVMGLFDNPDDVQDYSALLNKTDISLNWWKEYNFGYSRELYDSYNFSLNVGGTFRYLVGTALIDFYANNGQLELNDLVLSPSIGVELDNGEEKLNPNRGGQLFPEGVGDGYALDLGINARVFKNFYLGASLVNFGTMIWYKNALKIEDGGFEDFLGTGFNSNNVFVSEESALQFGGTENSVLQTSNVTSIRKYLPATLRVGGSYNHFNSVHIGFETVIPLNGVPGNLLSPYFAIGGDVKLNKRFIFSSGINYGGNFNGLPRIPVGLTYTNRKNKMEIGIASQDFTSWFATFGTGSTVSLAGGLMRVKL